MTIFEKVKNACESKETLAKLIHEQQFACYCCIRSDYCTGVEYYDVFNTEHIVTERHCVDGIMKWLDKEADDEPKQKIPESHGAQAPKG